jgi:hypothetical protein
VSNAPDRFGVVDRAAGFDTDPNTAGIIDLGARTEIDGSLSVALWLSRSANGFVFGSRGGIGVPSLFEYLLDNGTVRLVVREPGNTANVATFSDTAPLPADVWTHFVLVIDYEEASDTSAVRLYRDGTEVEGAGGTFDWRIDNDPAVTEMTIGATFNCSTSSSSPCYCAAIISAAECTNPQQSGGYDGLLDDFRLYARTLNVAEIADLYHEGGWPTP